MTYFLLTLTFATVAIIFCIFGFYLGCRRASKHFARTLSGLNISLSQSFCKQSVMARQAHKEV